MPAKKEYLSTRGQRTLKITAGLLGGYFLSLAIHLFAAALLPFKSEVMMTATFSLFILWVAFMILAFAAKSGLKVWGYYLLAISALSAFTYFLR
ncbi:hypothetical protein [Dyadobacter crusticola]|uniref:hypothetical protein n=1 Tax=Dyadobacter crusticola TaxID=292407 RepID=UPI00068AC4D5|nr:hypothetical protein [Dyadobacter crusticola]